MGCKEKKITWGDYSYYYLTYCDCCKDKIREDLKESVTMSVLYDMRDCDISTGRHKHLSVVGVDRLHSKIGGDGRMYFWKLTNSARLRLLKKIMG